MNKPVHERVAEKIATLFDDEERGYLWLSINQGMSKEAQDAAPLFDQAVFNDSYKLADENPQALAEVYEKVCSEMSPEEVQHIEKQAAQDYMVLKAQQEEFEKTAFLQGVYQYQGFKYAAAQDQTQHETSTQRDTLAQQAPALARAAGLSA